MAPRNREVIDVNAAAAALGQRGGFASAKSLTKAERIARARKAGKASGGWPKGKKRGKRVKVTK